MTTYTRYDHSAICELIPNGSKVLDLGCGNGIVGIAVAKGFPDSKITLVDVNKRAITTTRMNLKDNKLSNAKVKRSNGFEKIEDEEKFDTILLNPPQSAGKQLCLDLIKESKEYLKPNGTLQIVARHNKGGKVLSEHMKEIFDNAKVVIVPGSEFGETRNDHFRISFGSANETKLRESADRIIKYMETK